MDEDSIGIVKVEDSLSMEAAAAVDPGHDDVPGGQQEALEDDVLMIQMPDGTMHMVPKSFIAEDGTVTIPEGYSNPVQNTVLGPPEEYEPPSAPIELPTQEATTAAPDHQEQPVEQHNVVYMTPDGTIIQMDDNGNPMLPKTEDGNGLEAPQQVFVTETGEILNMQDAGNIAMKTEHHETHQLEDQLGMSAGFINDKVNADSVADFINDTTNELSGAHFVGPDGNIINPIGPDGQLIAADQHQNTIYVSEDGTVISAPGAAADLADPQGAPEAQQLVLPDGQQVVQGLTDGQTETIYVDEHGQVVQAPEPQLQPPSSAQPVTYITEDGTVVGYGDQSDDLAQMSLVPDATDSNAIPGGFEYKGDVKPVLLPRPKIKSEPIIEHLTADDDSEEKTYCYMDKEDGSIVKSNQPLKDEKYVPVLAPGMSSVPKRRGRPRKEESVLPGKTVATYVRRGQQAVLSYKRSRENTQETPVSHLTAAKKRRVLSKQLTSSGQIDLSALKKETTLGYDDPARVNARMRRNNITNQQDDFSDVDMAEMEENQCALCLTIFDDEKELSFHIGRHKLLEGEGFKCPHCTLKFISRQEMRDHMDTSHSTEAGEETKILRCKQCDFITTSSGDMNVHVNLEHAVKHEACQICGEVFPNRNKLYQHQRQAHDDHTCNVCHKTYCNLRKLRQHMKLHTGEAFFQCELCSKVFATQFNLQFHQRIHSDDRPYLCSVCGKGFKQKATLQSHQATHTGKKTHLCKHCGKGFYQPNQRNNHVKKAHSGEKHFQCSICFETFAKLGHVEKHMKVHARLITYICMVCGKQYTSKPPARKHVVRSHPQMKGVATDWIHQFVNNENPSAPTAPQGTETAADNVENTLDVANVMTTDAGHEVYVDPTSNIVSEIMAVTEQSVHPGVDNTANVVYKCAYCGKLYPDYDASSSHVAVYHMSPQEPIQTQSSQPSTEEHTEQLKFQCGACTRTFSHKQSLILHMKSHAVKPEACTVCFKRFSEAWIKEKHMMKHVDQDQNSQDCLVCNRSFAHEESLKRHMELDHTDAELSACGALIEHQEELNIIAESKGIEITNQSIDQTVQPGVQQTVQPGIQQTVEHGIEQTVEQDDPQYIFDMKTGHMIMASQPGGDVSGDVTGDVMMSTDGLMLQGNTSNENDLSAVKGLLDDDTLETLTMNDDKNLIYTPEAGLLLSIPEVKDKELIEGLMGHKDHSYQTAPNVNAIATDQEAVPLDTPTIPVESVSEVLPLRQNQCYVCHKVFPNRHRLRKHMLCHSGRPHACTVCGSRFILKHHLIKHLQTHIRGHNHMCTMCGITFKYKKIYDKHMEMHRNEGSELHQCPVCQIKFQNNQILQKHLAVHISTNIKQDHITGNVAQIDPPIMIAPIDQQASDAGVRVVEPAALVQTGPSEAVLDARAASAEEALHHISTTRSNATHIKDEPKEAAVKQERVEESHVEQTIETGDDVYVSVEGSEPVLLRVVESDDEGTEPLEGITTQVVAEEEVSSESKNLMLEGNSDGMVNVEQENVLEEQIETDVGHLELEMELNRQEVETEVVAMDTMPQSEPLMETEVVTMDTLPKVEPVLETGTVALAPGTISTEAQTAMETETISTEAQADTTEPEPAIVPLKAGSRDVKVDLAFVKVQAAAKKQISRLRSTSSSVRYKCDICAVHCGHVRLWKQHVKIMHKHVGSILSCEDCHQQFTSNATLQAHCTTMHPPTPKINSPQDKTDHDTAETNKANTTISPSIDLDSSNSLVETAKALIGMACPTDFTVSQTIQSAVIDTNDAVSTSYKCIRCTRTYGSALALSYHNRLAHTSKRVVCTLCDARFITKRELYQHCEINHELDTTHAWNCQICSRKFSRKSQYDRHKLLHNKEPLVKAVYNCPTCRCKFKYRTLLIHHMRTHSFDIDNGPYQCAQCYQSFPTLSLYKRHSGCSMEQESNLKHRCSYCYRAFPSEKRLQTHRTQVHVLPEDLIRCPECSQRFRQHSHMVMHRELFHNRICFHKCEMCFKSFASVDRLKKHIRAWKHFESPHGVTHKCELCDTTYRTKYAYERHARRMHCFEDSLKCQSCGLDGFKTGNDILKHAQCHYVEEHNFGCCVCGKPMETRESLENHLRYHMYPKGPIGGLNMEADHAETMKAQPGLVYRCETEGCGKCCITEAELKKHTCGLYACELCCNVYQNATKLAHHMFSSHGADEKILQDPEVKNASKLMQQPLRVKPSVAKRTGKISKKKITMNRVMSITKKVSAAPEIVISPKKPASKYQFILPRTKNLPTVLPSVTPRRITTIKRSPVTTPNVDNSMSCKWCSKVFRTHFNHKMHMKKVHNVVLADQENYNSEAVSDDDCDVPTIVIQEELSDSRGAYQTHASELYDDEHDSSDELADKLTCLDCGAQFDSVAGLTQHAKIHEIVYHQCMKCSEAFEDETLLRPHVAQHQTDCFMCRDCGKEFVLLSLLEEHYRKSHVDTKPFLCVECGVIFESAMLLTEHTQTHDAEARPCGLCFKTFENSWQLDRHLEQNHEGYSDHEEKEPSTDKAQNADKGLLGSDHLCRVCGHLSPNNRALVRHLREIHQEKPINIINDLSKMTSCRFCGRTFLIRKNLLHHLKNLHNVKVSGLDSLRGVGRPKLSDAAQPPEPPVEEVNKYKCAVCKMAYPIQSSVARHMRMTHGEDMDGLESDLFGYECGMCDDEFNTQNDYYNHVSAHIQSESGLGCTKCGIVYEDEDQLRKHLPAHVPAILAENCTQCTKHLPTRMSHSRHICSGTPAPPKPVVLKREFQCNRCPLSYDKDYLLEAHVQTAHPKRRGRPRKFTEQEASANKGTQLITTKKYYQCQICGIGFMLKGNLNRHWHCYHVDEETYLCHVCGDAFTDPEGLEEHNDIIHDQDLSGLPPIKNQTLCCPHCPALFACDANVKQHVTRFHGFNRCKVCGMDCKNTVTLKEHAIQAHLQCYKCDKRFKTGITVRRHIRKQHDVYDEDAEVSDDDYIPDEDENNQRPQVIVTHRDVDDDKHRCIYCKAALSSAEELAVHLDKLHGDEMVDSDGEVVEIHPYMRPPSVRGPYTGRPRGRPRTRPRLGEPGAPTAVMCGECNTVLSNTSMLPEHMMSVHGIHVKIVSGKASSAGGRGQTVLPSIGAGTGADAPGPAQELYECGHCHVRYEDEGELMNHLVEHQKQMQEEQLQQQQVELHPQEMQHLIAGTGLSQEVVADPGAGGDGGGAEPGQQQVVIIHQPDGTQQTVLCDGSNLTQDGSGMMHADLDQLLQQMNGAGAGAGVDNAQLPQMMSADSTTAGLGTEVEASMEYVGDQGVVVENVQTDAVMTEDGGLPVLMCQLCNKLFSTAEGIQLHQQQEHAEVMEQHIMEQQQQQVGVIEQQQVGVIEQQQQVGVIEQQQQVGVIEQQQQVGVMEQQQQVGVMEQQQQVGVIEQQQQVGVIEQQQQVGVMEQQQHVGVMEQESHIPSNIMEEQHIHEGLVQQEHHLPAEIIEQGHTPDNVLEPMVSDGTAQSMEGNSQEEPAAQEQLVVEDPSDQMMAGNQEEMEVDPEMGMPSENFGHQMDPDGAIAQEMDAAAAVVERKKEETQQMVTSPQQSNDLPSDPNSDLASDLQTADETQESKSIQIEQMDNGESIGGKIEESKDGALSDSILIEVTQKNEILENQGNASDIMDKNTPKNLNVEPLETETEMVEGGEMSIEDAVKTKDKEEKLEETATADEVTVKEARVTRQTRTTRNNTKKQPEPVPTSAKETPRKTRAQVAKECPTSRDSRKPPTTKDVKKSAPRSAKHSTKETVLPAKSTQKNTPATKSGKANPKMKTPVIPSTPEPGDYKCEKCTESFRTITKLRVHTAAVHMSHRCKTCKKGFNSDVLLDRHCQSVHGYSTMK